MELLALAFRWPLSYQIVFAAASQQVHLMQSDPAKLRKLQDFQDLVQLQP